jgi:poly-beta-1,6-N-acetyl-D-glucosamine biosynthesis protein PgaD
MMKTELIININTARRPLLRMRDSLLLLACWSLWSTVLVALLNGCEWDDLGNALLHFLSAQESFLASVLASLHIPPLYVFLTLLLTACFMLWSMINLAMAPMWRKQTRVPALTTADMARHFQLDQALLDAMQKEKQILVFHTVSGAVTELRRVPSLSQQQLLRA